MIQKLFNLSNQFNNLLTELKSYNTEKSPVRSRNLSIAITDFETAQLRLNHAISEIKNLTHDDKTETT